VNAGRSTLIFTPCEKYDTIDFVVFFSWRCDVEINPDNEKFAKKIANWIIGPVFSVINKNKIDINKFSEKVPAKNLMQLLSMIDD
jgi:Asp-tRNA(Asn)/Glu-tRNA(Gln) amidotransferase B subunit